ncbi:hypothetical protein [Bacillus sp. 03113]|uniref:hypothetical protein n=1 Tax=Bacillus sp. 03113 TaxID=2578211 RepID=UPI00215BD594|nr:hypothetical protein [Bacillus sp. 03113]
MIDQQNIDCMGGFIATYADAIMAHINPSNLHKHDIAIIIKGDVTIWGKRVTKKDTNQNHDEWLEIARDTIKPQKSPILKEVCFFKIQKGNLYGTYIISEDFMRNEQFSDEQSYLDFITK